MNLIPDAKSSVPLRLIIATSEDVVRDLRGANYRSVRLVMDPSTVFDINGELLPELSGFNEYVILILESQEDLRDAIAVNLGDIHCRWTYAPENTSDLEEAICSARPMWDQEVSTLDDIPEPGPTTSYTTGFEMLDDHGLRIVIPAFMPVIGPYGSGKSVFLRQLAINLWRLYGWKFLITSFEEKVKPRYQRDLRRHIIGKPVEEWTEEDTSSADAEINKCAVFLRRPRAAVLDLARLIDRVEFAVRVHRVRVVIIDPVNEIEHQVPKGETKTDYLAKFIMALKQLADDYNLLIIVAAHPPKDSVEKRLSKGGLLTLNDGADTAHYGNKADIGFCLWRDFDGPTFLHIDKLKDHESMGKPTLAEMSLDPTLNRFEVTRVGYDILQSPDEV